MTMVTARRVSHSRQPSASIELTTFDLMVIIPAKEGEKLTRKGA